MEFMPDNTVVQRGSTEHSTGDIEVTMIDVDPDTARPVVGAVRFAPRARTAWHRHVAGGQTLYCTDGEALVGTRGAAALLRPGDVVHAPAGEWHWHGAGAASRGCFVTLTEREVDPEAPYVIWGDPVTDDEYDEALRVARPAPVAPAR
ncbi:cupin domain-containing protein [Tsukamurella sp. NPDC003166]|uniref:cupin domain-containing protein n=1 Tax=Tsukamurella sp. NPDC003166 TaxID=3154444 RepID=UPI0033A795F0